MIGQWMLDVTVWADCPRGPCEGNAIFAVPENSDDFEALLKDVGEAVSVGLNAKGWRPGIGKMEVYAEIRPRAVFPDFKLAIADNRERARVYSLDWSQRVAKQEGGASNGEG